MNDASHLLVEADLSLRPHRRPCLHALHRATRRRPAAAAAPRTPVAGALRWGGRAAAVWLMSGAACHADRDWNRPGWDLVFADEFNGPTAAVDTTKWNVDDGPNAANNELQWYSRDNVFVENGNLVLKSEPRWINGYQFASGKVTTAGKFSPHYGRFEIRAKLPTGQGIWPAHWLLPYGHWPPEIDITELIGSQPRNLVASHHRGPLPPGCVYPWNCGMTHNATINRGVDWTADWHTFALEWDWWGIRWFVDGAETFASYYPPPDEPMFLILNTAVGGNWPGWPDGSTWWPQWHLIDHVRVYQRHYGATLLNGGFEQVEDGAFPNWNSDEDGNFAPDGTPANAHSGSRALQMWGRFNGAPNSSWLTQNLPAAEGQMWQASVWASNRPGDLLAGSNSARFKLEFIDGFGAILAQHALTVVDAATPPGYARFVIRQKAPRWTTHARLALEFNQAGDAGGAALFDDAELFLLTGEANAAARTLVNAGFESGDGDEFISWNPYGETPLIAAETDPANVGEGSRAARIAAGAAAAATGLYQDIPARPAEWWTARVSACTAAGAPLAGGNRALLKLEFVAADGSLLQQDGATVLDAASPPGAATATLERHAPAGTAFARIVVEHEQEPAGGGSVCFDGASLATTTATGELLNAGLELFDDTGFPGWTEYGAGWNVVADPVSSNSRSGAGAVQMFGQFTGADNESGMFQDMPAGRGEIWQASVWAQSRPGDPPQGDNFALLKLEFIDASGSVLDRDEVSVARAGSPEAYRQFTIRRAAPEWTARARLTIACCQRGNADGSVNFDDAELRHVTVSDPRPVLNPGFEEGDGDAFLNWPAWNNHGNIRREPVPGRTRSGSGAVQLFGAFQGTYNHSGLFQDLPAQQGELWQAAVWGRNRPDDPLQGDNRVRLKIEFLDDAGTILLANPLSVLTAASSSDYQPLAVRGRAPAGTSRARMAVEFVQPDYAPGSVLLDDAEVGVLTAAGPDRSLLDGGFEAGLGGEFAAWVPYGPGSLQNIMHDPVAGNARSGSRCLQLFGAYTGQDNSSGIYQDLPANPGELWQAGAWIRNRPGDPLQAGNRALLKLEFLDPLGALLQAAHVIAATAASPEAYQWFALRGVAPAGAATARIVIQLDQAGSADGSVNIDDAALQPVTAQDRPAVVNGGFEYRGDSDFTGWTRHDAGFNTLLDTDPAHARGGATALQMFGRFTGGTNNSDVYQDLPATGGQLWLASVWARNRPGDPLQGGNLGQLKLEFLGAGGEPLAASGQVVASAAGPSAYQQFAVLRAAPAGAAWARITLELLQSGDAAGSILFDDAALAVLDDLSGPQPAATTLWDGPLHPRGTVTLAGDLTLAAGASLDLEIRGPDPCCDYDRIEVAGRATLDGTLDVLLPGWLAGPPFVPQPGQSFHLLAAAQVAGAFAGVQVPPARDGGDAFALEYLPAAVALHVVDEPDRDADGLPDAWETAHFGSPVNANPALDADNDGASNLAEFTADTDPTNPASRFRILRVSAGAGGCAVSFLSSTHCTYTLQRAADPAAGPWGDVPSQTDVPRWR